jgi:hypothetical protein
MHVLWHLLMKFASETGRDIQVRFVYAHCGFSVHDHVDRLANAEAQTWTRETRFPPHDRHVAGACIAHDAETSRAALRDELQQQGALSSFFGPPNFVNTVTDAPLWTGAPRAHSDVARLRMGVSPLTGAFHAGAAAVGQCPACGVYVRRGAPGNSPAHPVVHMLACPRRAEARQLAFGSPAPVTPAVLYRQPMAAAQFARAAAGA